jgi:hypothetical protein
MSLGGLVVLIQLMTLAGNSRQGAKKMGRFLALLLAFFLAGCYSDQKQQLSACQLQVKQHMRTIQNIEAQDRKSSEETELCMQAHGYEIVEDNCPDYLRTDAIDVNPWKATLEAYEASLADKIRMKASKKIHPECYQPMGWLAKQILRFEKQIGLAS